LPYYSQVYRVLLIPARFSLFPFYHSLLVSLHILHLIPKTSLVHPQLLLLIGLNKSSFHFFSFYFPPNFCFVRIPFVGNSGKIFFFFFLTASSTCFFQLSRFISFFRRIHTSSWRTWMILISCSANVVISNLIATLAPACNA